MGKLKFEKGSFSNCTNVSNFFLDEFMPKANGDYVKIYLFLLRYASELNSDLSICKIADIFDYTEKDIVRALRYWEQAGLLSLEFEENKLTGIGLNDYPKSAPEKPVKKEVQEKKTYSAKDLEKLSQEKELCQLLYIVQKYLGKSLSPAETNTILYFYDTLKFSTDLIEYLVEYCVSKDHKSMRYIEKVALAWSEKNVTSINEAKKLSVSNKNTFSQILGAFGIMGRAPGESEKAFIVRWTDEYGFDLDVIIEACNRTIEKIHQPSFEYAESILKKWRDSGIKDVSDIKLSDQEWTKQQKAKKPKEIQKSTKANNFTGFSQRTYDYAELEKQLLK